MVSDETMQEVDPREPKKEDDPYYQKRELESDEITEYRRPWETAPSP